MYTVQPEILEKHKVALEAARNYWVFCKPTGLSDEYFNELEAAARADGLELRDYVCQEIQGTRTQNASYIPKVQKQQVQGSMAQAVIEFQKAWGSEHPESPELTWIPKYDGSSLAAYYDPDTGRCVRVVTIGGSNLGDWGIDQTEKFAKFFPNTSGTGIIAMQAECLIALEHGFSEKSRQKANGLVNASYEPMSCQDFLAGSQAKTRTQADYEKYLAKFKENQESVQAEIEEYIGIRCFRYFTNGQYPVPPYYEALRGMPVVVNPKTGDIKFSGGYTMTLTELLSLGDQVEKDIWKTPTGTFLVDGLVAYTASGECVKALKYKDAGRGESVKVLDIKWNNQIKKGKDSWSANAIVEPITIRGSVITKPTIGSVKKMVSGGISPGARVTLILANSTIPAISEVLEPGNGDYKWPICSCGYQMGPTDTFGSLLKCGNPMCSERLGRMKSYLSGLDWSDVDLDKLLIMDRMKLSKVPGLKDAIKATLETPGNGPENLRDTIGAILSTDLQRRNLELIYRPAWEALYERYIGDKGTN